MIRRIAAICFFVPYFLYELALANVRIALNVTITGSSLRPAIVAMPTRARGPVQITVLANLLSLTPGTLVVDVTADHSVMFVHTLHLEELENFPKFEERFLRMFR